MPTPTRLRSQVILLMFSKYKHVRTRKMNLDIVSTTVSVVAGVIASFIGTPVTAAVLTVATGYVSSKLKKLYWKESLHEYKENVYQYRRWSNTSESNTIEIC